MADFVRGIERWVVGGKTRCPLLAYWQAGLPVSRRVGISEADSETVWF